MDFGWSSVVLAFLTVQRLAELCWAKENERRLFAAGGIEHGRPHLPLMIALHAAWMAGLWLFAPDRPVDPLFLALLLVLQLARLWAVASRPRPPGRPHVSGAARRPANRAAVGLDDARAALVDPRHRHSGREAP